jgi:hypothetical protein
MRQFITGIIVGSALTASLGLAGNFYNDKGQPAGPRGSVQQYDYFRQRQQYLDINAMRKQVDRAATEQRLNPCER